MARTKKVKKNVINGRLYAQLTFNNTIITVTDDAGNAISWASAGSHGFKGVKKSTPYAAQVTTETVLKRSQDFGLERLEIYVKGPGSGRESVIRTVMNMGLSVTLLKDVTPIPHNGCRPKKVRHG